MQECNLEVRRSGLHLTAIGSVLNSKNRILIREAVLLLNRVLRGASGRRIGNVTKASAIVTKEGIRVVKKTELKAGERLGAILERKRQELGIDIEALAEDLPIRSDVYERIEFGFNTRPPDDILEAIAKQLKLNADDLKETADLDKESPVEQFFF